MGSPGIRKALGSDPKRPTALIHVRVSNILLTDEAFEDLAALQRSDLKEAESILRRVDALKTSLVADALHGEVVRNSAIPMGLKARYDISNLYVEDLPAFWRLLYTIARTAGVPRVTVLRVVNHHTYSRWFPGRRR